MKNLIVFLSDMDGTVIGKNYIDTVTISKINELVEQFSSKIGFLGYLITGRGIEFSELVMNLYLKFFKTTYAEYGGVILKRYLDNIVWEYSISPSERLEILKITEYILKESSLILEPKETMITLRVNEKIEEVYEKVKKNIIRFGVEFEDLIKNEKYGKSPKYKLTHSKIGIDLLRKEFGKDYCVVLAFNEIEKYIRNNKIKNVFISLAGDSPNDIPLFDSKEYILSRLEKLKKEEYIENYKLRLYGVNPSEKLKDYLNRVKGYIIEEGSPEKCILKIVLKAVKTLNIS